MSLSIKNILNRTSFAVAGNAVTRVTGGARRHGVVLHNTSTSRSIWIKLIKKGDTLPALAENDKDAVLPPESSLILAAHSEIEIAAKNDSGSSTEVGLTVIEVDGVAQSGFISTGQTKSFVSGPSAHDASASAVNPVIVGGEGRSSEPTAVSSGDAVRSLSTLLGKQVVIPWCLPSSLWCYAAPSGGVTDTSDRAFQAAAGAGIRNYCSSFSLSNAHASTDTEVLIVDGYGGATLWRGKVQAGKSIECSFPTPLRGSANTPLLYFCVTGGAQVYLNAQGFTSAE